MSLAMPSRTRNSKMILIGNSTIGVVWWGCDFYSSFASNYHTTCTCFVSSVRDCPFYIYYPDLGFATGKREDRRALFRLVTFPCLCDCRFTDKLDPCVVDASWLRFIRFRLGTLPLCNCCYTPLSSGLSYRFYEESVCFKLRVL